MTSTEISVIQKRINVCEYIVNMVPVTVSSMSHQSTEQKEGRSGGDGGKIEWKLSEVNTRAVSQGQNEFIHEFKVAADGVISIGG